MSVTQLKQVEATYDANVPAWVVRMTFRDAGAKRFVSLTERAARRQSPQNQIAIVLGDRLLSAPSVAAPSPAAKASIEFSTCASVAPTR